MATGRRTLASSTIVLAVACATTLPAMGCGVLAGIDEFQRVDPDASSAFVADARVTGGCSGFMCGATCAATTDPSYGCSPANDCLPCPGRPHAATTCQNGDCATECSEGFLECNNLDGDGCEVDRNSDPNHCGACGQSCVAALTPYCVDGQCAIACTAPKTDCSGACVDLQTSVSHCGTCQIACPTPANAKPDCTAGKCSFTCLAGWGDCNGTSNDGCEAFLNGNDVNHCGSCNACPAAGGGFVGTTAACQNGKCVSVCNNGAVDCDGNAGNGCECNLSGSECRSGVCTQCAALGNGCTDDAKCCGGLTTTRCSNAASDQNGICVSRVGG